MSARWRRAIFSNPIRMSAARTHGESGRLPHRARRRCATTGEAEEGVEEEVRSRGQTLPLLRKARSAGVGSVVYLVARGGLIRKMWSVARVNDVYSHR